MTQPPDRLIVSLPNRMIIIARRLPAAPVVCAQVWTRAGALYEQEHNGKGLSHFLEHLLAGGSTSTRTEDETNVLLGAIGAQTNASTSLDHVHYHINTSAASAEAAIDLLSDWMMNNLVTETEFRRERDVIQREFEMGAAEPARVFWKLTQIARFNRHPARHPVIGYLDEFLSVTRDELYGYYRKMYVPANLIFSVAGDIDPAAVVERISRLWGGLPSGELPVVKFPRELPPPGSSITGHADIDRPRLRMIWPGTRLGAEGDFALDLLSHILGDGEMSRLVQEIRNRRRLATSIDAYNYSPCWAEGFFGVDLILNIPQPEAVSPLIRRKADPRAAPLNDQEAAILERYQRDVREKLAEARDAVLDEIDRLIGQGLTQAELDRAKRKTLAGALMACQTAQETAGRGASDLIATGDPDYLKTYSAKIQELTAEELLAAARRYLVRPALTTLQLLPLDGPFTALGRPQENTAAPLDPQKPFEEISLDNRAIIQRLGLEERRHETRLLRSADLPAPKMFRLPNGLRVIYQSNPSMPIVAMRWYQHGGQLSDPAGSEGLAYAMGCMMMKGAAGRTASQIATLIEDLGAHLSTGAGPGHFYAAADCLASDWKAVLGIMADLVLRPDFPEDEWGMMRPRILAVIASANDQWSGHLRNEFKKVWYGDHPWAHPAAGRAEVVSSLDPSQLRKFHAGHVAAQDSVLAIFGDVEAEEAVSEAGRLFGAMAAVPVTPFAPPEPRAAGSQILQVATSKPLAAVQIGFGPGMKADNPDYPAMRVLTRIISNFPTGWLDQELRGRGPGLVYAVGAGMVTGSIPGYWSILFNTSPDSVRQAMERSMEVVRRIRSAAVAPAELERARSAVMVEEFIGRQTNGQRAAEAALGELYGMGLEAGERFIQGVMAVDSAHILRVADKYLSSPVAVVLSHQPVDTTGLAIWDGERKS